jgi:hypothetical protein
VSVTISDGIHGRLPELFECVATPRGHQRVRTPFLFPDGGLVDVYVVERDGGRFEVTDFGEALGWLRLQTVSGRRSPKQDRLLQDACLTHGVEMFRGQLLARCPDREGISDCVVRVAQAVVRVADLWFTTRTRSVESVTEEVADFLEERRISYERGVRLPGRSGRIWTVDFQARSPTRSSLVVVLATGSRPVAKRITEHVVTVWYDLSPLRIGPQATRFMSLFDDTSDVWSDEDFRLVESLSDIAHWSRPDEVEELLLAA